MGVGVIVIVQQMRNFSPMSWRKKVTIQCAYGDEIRFALDQHA